jgi:hypothetical protein
VRTAEPCRPPIPTLLNDGESCVGGENDAPPSAETETITGSAGSCSAERNWVQLTYTRPKNGLVASLSAQIDSLSLKLFGLLLVAAMTGALQVRPLSSEACRIADALAGGPLPSSALRALVGHRGRYDQAINQLHQLLLVTSAGVQQQRTGWPPVLIDLTCRRFEVGGRTDRRYAITRFLDTMIEATPAELAGTFGWPAAQARAALDELVAAGRGVRSPSGYRLARS